MTSSKQSIQQLTPEMNRMIALKYCMKSFGQMTINEMKDWAEKLLIKIHIITGWQIPAEEIMFVLVEQWQKKIFESYTALNPEEIEHAFRTNGTQVEDYGKSINLNLIDKVLMPYLNTRFKISEDERKVRDKENPPPTKIFTQAELDDSAREDAERQYQMFLRGYELRGVEIIRAILLHDEMIKPQEPITEFFKRKAEAGCNHIYVKNV